MGPTSTCTCPDGGRGQRQQRAKWRGNNTLLHTHMLCRNTPRHATSQPTHPNNHVSVRAKERGKMFQEQTVQLFQTRLSFLILHSTSKLSGWNSTSVHSLLPLQIQGEKRGVAVKIIAICELTRMHRQSKGSTAHTTLMQTPLSASLCVSLCGCVRTSARVYYVHVYACVCAQMYAC